MLYGEKLREICNKLGIDPERLDNKLYSTLLDEICNCCGTGGVTPTGTLDITENGNYDVTRYASVNVNVASEGGETEKIYDLTGTTWLINEELDIPTARTHMLNHTSNGENFTYFWFMGKGALSYDGNANPSSFAYNHSNGGWKDEAYRTITITGGQHATDMLLILWLQNNATQVK